VIWFSRLERKAPLLSRGNKGVVMGIKPNWKPLEDRVGPKRCVGFMYTGFANGVHLFKHGMARMYLNLDDRGECYVLRGTRYERADFDVELGKIEQALAVIDETLESTYDDDYIARREAAFRKAGIPSLYIEFEPEDLSIN
jgi:hypothetical protein